MKHYRCLFLLLCIICGNANAFRRLQLSLPSLKRRLPLFRRGANKQMTKGNSSFGASIFNLVNNVAGAGILALSAGQARGSGYIPSVGLCAALGMVSGRTFAMIGEACDLLEVETFKDLWAATLGEDSTYMVDSMIAVLCVACCIIYSGILGDVLTPLLNQIQFPYNGRASNIMAVTLALLLPMSLIKDFSALAFTSTLGFCSIVYTALFIVVRALDGSYKLGVGRFVSDGRSLDLMPSFEKASMWNIDFSSLVLASNLGLAYIAHYNGPTFYRSLKDASTERFSNMVMASFTILIVLYSVTMVAGYSTFGDVCRGNILLNYHGDDLLATLGRVATFLSILFGFPLVATGAREGIVGAATSLGLGFISQPKNHFWVVSVMLVVVTAVSCTVEDVSLVMGLTGASLGAFVVYICPGLLYSRALRKVYGPNSDQEGKIRRSRLLIPFGLLVGGFGVYMTLQK